MVSGVIYLSPDKTTSAQWAHIMHSFFDQHWEWGPLSIWCCHTLLPWITPDLPLHCLQPIYTASSSLAVTETAVLSQEAWKTSSVSRVSHLSLQSLTSGDIPAQFYELHLPFLVVWGFFWSVFVCFSSRWPLRAHRWHRGSGGNAVCLICTLRSVWHQTGFPRMDLNVTVPRMNCKVLFVITG